MSNEYKSALSRLARAHTAQDLEQLETSFTRLYKAGIFTDNEFLHLAWGLVDKMIEVTQ